MFLDVHQSADEVSVFVWVFCVQFMIEVKNGHIHPAGESPPQLSWVLLSHLHNPF